MIGWMIESEAMRRVKLGRSRSSELIVVIEIYWGYSWREAISPCRAFWLPILIATNNYIWNLRAMGLRRSKSIVFKVLLAKHLLAWQVHVVHTWILCYCARTWTIAYNWFFKYKFYLWSLLMSADCRLLGSGGDLSLRWVGSLGSASEKRSILFDYMD